MHYYYFKQKPNNLDLPWGPEMDPKDNPFQYIIKQLQQLSVPSRPDCIYGPALLELSVARKEAREPEGSACCLYHQNVQIYSFAGFIAQNATRY